GGLPGRGAVHRPRHRQLQRGQHGDVGGLRREPGPDAPPRRPARGARLRHPHGRRRHPPGALLVVRAVQAPPVRRGGPHRRLRRRRHRAQPRRRGRCAARQRAALADRVPRPAGTGAGGARRVPEEGQAARPPERAGDRRLLRAPGHRLHRRGVPDGRGQPAPPLQGGAQRARGRLAGHQARLLLRVPRQGGRPVPPRGPGLAGGAAPVHVVRGADHGRGLRLLPPRRARPGRGARARRGAGVEGPPAPPPQRRRPGRCRRRGRRDGRGGGGAGAPVSRPFAEGDQVLLVDAKKRRYLVTLTAGGEFHTHAGVVAHDDVLGRPEGLTVRSSRGASMVALRPTLAEFVLKMPRGAQVIYPKDLGPILMLADIFPGARVLESGVGSGALSMTLVRAGAIVRGYEIREDFARRATRNVATFLGEEALERYVVEQRDVYEGIDETDLDRVLLDLPEPWRAVK